MPQLELPKFEATKSEDFPGFLVIYCPQEDCPSFAKRPFVVHTNTFLKKRLSAVARKDGKQIVLRGRPCPYCFKVAEIPKRVEIR